MARTLYLSETRSPACISDRAILMVTFSYGEEIKTQVNAIYNNADTANWLIQAKNIFYLYFVLDIKRANKRVNITALKPPFSFT